MCVPGAADRLPRNQKAGTRDTACAGVAGEIKIERYWQPDFSKKLDISEQEAGERTIEILRDAVKVRLMSEVPLGAFLSGGIDSSAVVALMSEESSAPVKTFSIGFEEQDFSELHHARRVAEHVGADHHEFIVRPGCAGSFAVTGRTLRRALRGFLSHSDLLRGARNAKACDGRFERRRRRRVVCRLRALRGDATGRAVSSHTGAVARVGSATGDRANAVVGNEARPHSRREAFYSSRIVAEGRTLLFAGSASSMPRRSRICTRRKFAATNAERSRLPACSIHGLRSANGSGIVDAALLTDIMTYLPNDLLVKVDIATMANSLEARSPFLDHHVIEFAASLPETVQVARTDHQVFVEADAEDSCLPAENLDRRKMGFGVPIGHWLRGKLQPFLRETLLAGDVVESWTLSDRKRSDVWLSCTRAASETIPHQLWTLLMLGAVVSKVY